MMEDGNRQLETCPERAEGLEIRAARRWRLALFREI